MYSDNVSIIAPITSLQSKGAAVSVIRVSGKESIKLCNNIFRSKDLEKEPSHSIHFGKIFFNKTVIDEVLVSIFKAPNSYTGENTVEISCHASPFIVNKIIEIFITLGARVAKAGEFTKRAFLNGKLDLLQAESIALLIAAKNKYEHQAALKVLTGRLSSKIKHLRDYLIKAKSLIELEIDFSEDHNIDVNSISNLKLLINNIKEEITALTIGFSNKKESTAQVVIIGDPNVGKSSLFNAIIEYDRAIVSDIAGTTRDIVSETVIDKDIEFVINDTAGLRETKDAIESIGIDKAYKKTENADVILYVFDIKNIARKDLEKKIIKFDKSKVLLIASKSDTFDKDQYLEYSSSFKNLFFVSALDNIGIKDLKNKISSIIESKFNNDSTMLINARHNELLTKALISLENAIKELDKLPLAYEIVAFELNEAIMQLKSITGEITNDTYLSEIFANFCIGK